MVLSIHDLYLLFLWLELFAYLKDYKNNFFNINHTPEVWKTRNIPLTSVTTVEAHSCLLNMHVTFDLTGIEMMPQQARKQLEAELETSCCSLVAS